MKSCALLLLALPALATNARAQESIPQTEFDIYITAGYTRAALTEVQDYFSDVLAASLIAPSGGSLQTRFGDAFIMDLGVLLSRMKPFHAGFAVGFWSAPASGSFQGVRGRFTMNGSTTAILVSFVVQATPVSTDLFSLFFRAKPFVYRTSSGFSSRLYVYQPTPGVLDSELSLSGWNVGGQAAAGIAFPVGRIFFSLEAGYRYARAGGCQGTITSTLGYPNVVPDPSSVSWTLSQSGVVFLGSIGLTI